MGAQARSCLHKRKQQAQQYIVNSTKNAHCNSIQAAIVKENQLLLPLLLQRREAVLRSTYARLPTPALLLRCPAQPQPPSSSSGMRLSCAGPATMTWRHGRTCMAWHDGGRHAHARSAADQCICNARWACVCMCMHERAYRSGLHGAVVVPPGHDGRHHGRHARAATDQHMALACMCPSS